MVHHVPELIVSDELAKEIGNKDQEQILKSGRLVLVVDLDQTLIHTTTQSSSNLNCSSPDVHSYRLYDTQFLTKIRPGVSGFLKRICPLFEMHVITFGRRQYAHKIAQLLDPDQRYFGHRIMSRDELFSDQHKTPNQGLISMR